MPKTNLNITNYYIHSFIQPAEETLQLLDNSFKIKSFSLEKKYIELCSFTKPVGRRTHKSRFDTYFPNTISIMIDKKIERIRDIKKPILVTNDEKRFDDCYKSTDYSNYYDLSLLDGDIPIKYIKGMIFPSEKHLLDPFIFCLFLGKYDLNEYLEGLYTNPEISGMRANAKKNFSFDEIKKYLDGYLAALDRMMMQSDAYIPQFVYNDENPKILLKR